MSTLVNADSEEDCPEFRLPNWAPRKIVLGTLVVVGTALAFWSAYLFERVLVCLLIGIVLDIALTPLIQRFVAAGFPRSVAVTMIYLSLGAGCIGIAALSAPMLIEQSADVGNRMPDAYVRMRAELVSTSSQRVNDLASRLPESWPPVELDGAVGARLSESLSSEESLTEIISRSVFLTLGVILLAFYWSLHGPRTITGALLLLPDSRRNEARELVNDIHTRVGGFIRGQGLLCLTIGIVSFIAYWWIGLPYALLLAALAGVMEMVPYFGPTLSTVPAVLTALTARPELAVWTLAACILIQVLENYILVPRIMGQSIGVHPVGIVLAMLCFGILLGGIGVVVAVPFAAVVQILVERYLLKDETAEIPVPTARDRISRLRYEANDLIQDVRQQLRKKDVPATEVADELEDEIESIAIDLERELAELEGVRDRALEALNSTP
ncbi:MAG: AI-2E family transporter [Planctomycetaceae bacterium]